MSGLKETALLGMLLFSLMIAGCGSKEAQSVTIIGGADGPTSIYLAGTLRGFFDARFLTVWQQGAD